MNCKYCGNEINEGAAFCATCGKVAFESEPLAVVLETPEEIEQRSGLAGRILTLGILALAFAETFFLSFLGIIFGAMAKSKASRYEIECGELTGKARVGKILGTIGLILGIVLSVIAVIYVAFVVISLLLYFME